MTTYTEQGCYRKLYGNLIESVPHYRTRTDSRVEFLKAVLHDFSYPPRNIILFLLLVTVSMTGCKIPQEAALTFASTNEFKAGDRIMSYRYGQENAYHFIENRTKVDVVCAGAGCTEGRNIDVCIVAGDERKVIQIDEEGKMLDVATLSDRNITDIAQVPEEESKEVIAYAAEEVKSCTIEGNECQCVKRNNMYAVLSCEPQSPKIETTNGVWVFMTYQGKEFVYNPLFSEWQKIEGLKFDTAPEGVVTRKVYE